MFSTDKNIESLACLVEKLKEYLQLRKSLLQVNLMEKIVRLLTACALTILLVFFFFLIVIFLSFAAVYALSLFMPLWGAFLVVAGVQLLFFIIIYLKRHSWIQQPLVRVLVNILSA
ncbi:MAG: phage holin family protein [Prevotella sp.]